MTEWQPIETAPKNGKETWLGWKPFVDGSGVEPRRGHWDIGSKQWIAHWEDHGDTDGQTPIPFEPQPDYYCDGYVPEPPTE
jgi:hypothetical protein